MSDDEDWGYASLPEEYRTETPGADRTREARHASPPTWKRPQVATHATCFAPGCTNSVEVTEEAMAGFASFSRQLTAKGEKPLELGEVFNCVACGVIRSEVALERSADRRAKTRRAIRLLKGIEAWTREGECAALEYLEKVMGKGYVVDLVRCIAEKRGNQKQKPRREEI